MRIIEGLPNNRKQHKVHGVAANPEIAIEQEIDEKDRIFFCPEWRNWHIPQVARQSLRAFYKVDKKIDGTGTGLAIVKRNIEVHSGRIWIEWELGKGCMVCFTLPLVDYQ